MSHGQRDMPLPVMDPAAEPVEAYHEADSPDRVAALENASNLTPSQLLIWMGQKINPSTPLYNMALTFQITGTLDAKAFGFAFDALVEHTDAMRMVIEETGAGGAPRMRFIEPATNALECLDFSSEPDPVAAVRSWAQEQTAKPFDLGRHLFKSAMIKIADDGHVWYLNQHHLITDGWAKSAVYQQMCDLYRLALADRLHEAQPLPCFTDYAKQLKSKRVTESSRNAQTHWRQQSETRFPPARFYGRSPADPTSRTLRLFNELGVDRTKRLKAIADSKEVRSFTLDMTLYQVFLTLLFAYMHRVGDSNDLRIGTPFHHRTTADHRRTAGLFMEVFPLGVNIDEDETFLTLLNKVKTESLQGLRNAWPGSGNARLHRTYNAVLNYINTSFPSFDGMPIQCEWVHAGHGDPGHWLRLQVHDFQEAQNIQLHFDLNQDVFGPHMNERVVEHFFNLLDAFLTDPSQPIAATSLLSQEETDQTVTRFNDTAAPSPTDQTVVQLFESIAKETPDATALQCQGRQLTYQQLSQRANQLAHTLCQHGVGPNKIVAVCTKRSVEMITALLGVLKAGAAYVPIDPNLPAQRVSYMLQDSGASVILTPASQASQLPPHDATVLHLDDDDTGDTDAGLDNPLPASTPTDLAYVIYTSGSTGQPKGVEIEHRNLVSYLWWARCQYVGDQRPAIPLYTSFSFDLTVTSIFLPLICGGRVVIYPEDDSGVDLAILQVFDEDAVDIIKATPAHLSLLLDKQRKTSRTRKLIVGGEDLKRDLAEKTLAVFGGRVDIYNEYGPTEATVGCMIHRFDPGVDNGVSVPIGVPADNASIYLLDHRLNPIPTGVEGEIYIGGNGVARGYLNQPQLTAECFVSDPFRPGTRMYKTGDTARRNARGLIEYLGRGDGQVKIRGVRIELGEVQSALASYPGIKACIAVDVDKRSEKIPPNGVSYCKKCGLASNHPEANINADGVCALCFNFDAHRDKAQQYFKTTAELHTLVDRAKTERFKRNAQHDCLMLYSGGKDSTYALYQLAEMGLKVLVFTLDNGYISDEAKANIQRVVDDLGFELVAGHTPAMNAIFVDSLKRHGNVCQGCYKTIYTLSMNLARQRGIRYIFTGLSRGQFFETRVAELFRSQVFDREEIDRNITEARKAYHRMDDAVSKYLDVSMFKDDAVFSDIVFVDFYRYCDVELDQMLDFLNKRAPWIRPSDTGRSTNCLINDVGIYVHKKKRGFHNYALPYSWDVRLGHKNRDEALAELDDQIDRAGVAKILAEIGYDEPDIAPAPDSEKRLAAYYVASSPTAATDLRAYLLEQLPDYMIPSYFVQLDELPLTAAGKVDRKALPYPDQQHTHSTQEHTPPSTPAETLLAEIWAKALGLDQVGIHDNFFDLGGDSIVNIQIIAKANQAGLRITPSQLFQNPTIAELAKLMGTTPIAQAQQGPVTGPLQPIPIQHWLLEQDPPQPDHWNQACAIELPHNTNPDKLEQALQQLVLHHDALRLQAAKGTDGWQLSIGDTKNTTTLDRVDLSERPEDQHAPTVEAAKAHAHTQLNLAAGQTVRAVYFDPGHQQPKQLFIAIHHLAVDGLSWRVLLEDLETAYHQISKNQTPRLPMKTTSFKQWSQQLIEHAQTDQTLQEARDYWLPHSQEPTTTLPTDFSTQADLAECNASTVSVSLDPDQTQRLLKQPMAGTQATAHELLLASMAHGVSQWAGQGTLAIDVEGHGRDTLSDTVDVSRTVGWFTAIYPLHLPLPDTNDPFKTLQTVQEQTRRVPHGGIGYGLARYLCQDTEIKQAVGSSRPSQLLFNYMGKIDRLAPQSSWLRLAEPITASRAPQNHRPYLLEVNAWVFDKKLRVDWTYNTSAHRPETVEQLAHACIQTLQTLVTDDQGPQRQTPQATDFSLANLNNSQLAKIAKQLNKHNGS